jgi:DnaJ-class molecular chaperone
MHLQFKFEIFGKKSTNRNKLRKNIKKFKIGPNFKIEFKTMYYSTTKNWAQKTKKTKNLCRGPGLRPSAKTIFLKKIGQKTG